MRILLLSLAFLLASSGAEAAALGIDGLEHGIAYDPMKLIESVRGKIGR